MTCDICGDVNCSGHKDGKYGENHPQCGNDGCNTYLDTEESLDCGICVFCRKEKRWRNEEAWERMFGDEFGEYDEEAWG